MKSEKQKSEKQKERPKSPLVEGRIEIKFGNEIYRGNYLTDLKINESTLNDALMTQPSLYVFWARMVAMARVILEKWKMEVDKYEAQTYTFMRSQAEQRGEKITEKMLDAKIKVDPKSVELRKKLLKARLQYDHLAAVMKAFEMRTNMLMSLAANLREEMDTTLALREKEFVEKRLEGRAKKPEGPKE